jgi:hypothetical protein
MDIGDRALRGGTCSSNVPLPFMKNWQDQDKDLVHGTAACEALDQEDAIMKDLEAKLKARDEAHPQDWSRKKYHHVQYVPPALTLAEVRRE